MNFPILDLFYGYDSENFSIFFKKDSPNIIQDGFPVLKGLSNQGSVLIETVLVEDIL